LLCFRGYTPVGYTGLVTQCDSLRPCAGPGIAREPPSVPGSHSGHKVPGRSASSGCQASQRSALTSGGHKPAFAWCGTSTLTRCPALHGLGRPWQVARHRCNGRRRGPRWV
jgi:hypothetical protein